MSQSHDVYLWWSKTHLDPHISIHRHKWIDKINVWVYRRYNIWITRGTCACIRCFVLVLWCCCLWELLWCHLADGFENAQTARGIFGEQNLPFLQKMNTAYLSLDDRHFYTKISIKPCTQLPLRITPIKTTPLTHLALSWKEKSWNCDWQLTGRGAMRLSSYLEVVSVLAMLGCKSTELQYWPRPISMLLGCKSLGSVVLDFGLCCYHLRQFGWKRIRRIIYLIRDLRFGVDVWHLCCFLGTDHERSQVSCLTENSRLPFGCRGNITTMKHSQPILSLCGSFHELPMKSMSTHLVSGIDADVARESLFWDIFMYSRSLVSYHQMRRLEYRINALCPALAVWFSCHLPLGFLWFSVVIPEIATWLILPVAYACLKD